MKLRLFFRMIKRQRMAWTLNVLCLSVAFAVLFIVVKQVKYDFSYDTCYPKVDQLYRLDYLDKADGKQDCNISMPVIHETIGAIPEVAAYTILHIRVHYGNFYCDDREYQQIPYYGVYPGFWEVFGPRVIAGDAEEAIKNRNGIVIPRSLAKKWFGEEDPINRNIGFGSKNNSWLVKAVYEDFPENSTLTNAVLLRLEEDKRWDEWSYNCFLRLVDGAVGTEVEQKIVHYIDSLYNADLNGEKLSSKIREYRLLPVRDMYFSDINILLKEGGNGNQALSLTLLAIGVLIILVAYVNFINFSTALAPTRIGVFNICQINGASYGRLRREIVLEAVFLSLVAWVISIFWVYGFSETALAKAYLSASLNPFQNAGLCLCMGGGALSIGLLAGMYPAWYMTSFQPALVLKGAFSLGASGRRLRDGLLVFQFVVTLVLIISSWFVVLQRDYMRNLPWGYEKKNVVYLRTNQEIEKNPEVLRTELMKNPDVLGVTASRYLPGERFMEWGMSFMDRRVQFAAWPVDPYFLDVFGIPVLEGENFRKPPQGKDYVILNRRMLEKFNLEEVIGQEIGCFDNMGTVIGISENVNFASVHNIIEPMAFVCGDDMWNNYIFVKIRSERIPETIAHIKKCFRGLGGTECEVTFLDDFINRLYVREENLSLLISLFCLITVIISLAGIYGLLVFNVRYKVKEVGIRKINGATGSQILWMLNRVFIWLVICGYVVAVPVSVVLVEHWLSSYPYHTPMHWWVFAVALLLTLMITLVTVWYQSWKAANANPIDAVKTE